MFSSQAEEIHVLTGAMVSLKIVAESKRVHEYHSHPKTYMNFWTQKGSVTLPPTAKSKVKPNHTPKKTKSKRRETVHLLSRLNIINLPGIFDNKGIFMTIAYGS